MMIRILFVCMGNICRSPTAQGVFEYLVSSEELSDAIAIDSAGTYAYHIGELPDARARAAALKRGIDLGNQRARRIMESDFQEFDYVLAMDHENYNDLTEICPSDQAGKLRLFLDFAPELGVREVPDPYYGGSTGFERVLDLVEHASRGLLAAIRQQHGV
ncbi:MAG: low molecular weight phosphotyrosine protein phosphatase [Gammaproteobacteria bacterium]|nr:MAG: low molecular weight phosphotyrosine protein phosphatase [Gammaproteobacteria bacterium]